MNIINEEDKEVIEELFEIEEYDDYYHFTPITDNSFIEDTFIFHPLNIIKNSEYSVTEQLSFYLYDINRLYDYHFTVNYEDSEVKMSKVYFLDVAMLADYLAGIVDEDYLIHCQSAIQKIFDEDLSFEKKKEKSLVA